MTGASGRLAFVILVAGFVLFFIFYNINLADKTGRNMSEPSE